MLADEFTVVAWDAPGVGRSSDPPADLRDVLPRIEAPTLLLYGDADTRSPLDVGEALHAQIPTSRLVGLAGAGHLSNVEAADRFNAEVRTFMRRHT